MPDNSLDDNKNKRREQQTYIFPISDWKKTAYVKINVLNQCLYIYNSFSN